MINDTKNGGPDCSADTAGYASGCAHEGQESAGHGSADVAKALNKVVTEEPVSMSDQLPFRKQILKRAKFARDEVEGDVFWLEGGARGDGSEAAASEIWGFHRANGVIEGAAKLGVVFGRTKCQNW